MTRDEVIQLAQNAGFQSPDFFKITVKHAPIETIERFANTIEQRTLERVVDKLLQLGALGDGTYIEAIRALGETK